MKKKILYNLLCSQPSGDSKYHGGGEYAKKVFKELALNYRDECEISVFYDENRFLDDWIYEILKENKIKHYNISNLKEIEPILASNNFDVYYTGLTSTENEIVFPLKIRKVATIHGMRSVELICDSKLIQYGNIKEKISTILKCLISKRIRNKHIKELKKLVDCFDDVICVSNHSKFAFKVYLNEDEKIKMYYSPIKNHALVTKDIEENILNLYGDYLLFIGGNRWLKNPYRFIEAIVNLIKKRTLSQNIIIVGKLSEKCESLISKYNNIINLDYVSPEELESLYKNCRVFIYPTLNEGFGIPPLEAMRYGTTCIVSGICSLPEIYGDAVYYCNPYDIGEIENRILYALKYPISRLKVIDKFENIQMIQELDLENLCKFIIK